MNTVATRAALVLCLALCGTGAQASVQISSAATKNMNCSAGVCTPTAKDAVLNVDDLTNMLASADVIVKSGTRAVTIGILSPFAWASTHRLTLDAEFNVNIKAPVMVEGTSGLTITTNDGDTGGDLVFYPGGKIDFWDLSSSLIINGNSYQLVGDIKTLAAGIAKSASGHYALANDYDASLDGKYSDSPVATELTGTFEGLGHGISNLSIESDGSIALFFKASGTLRDVDLRKVNIVTFGNAASLLAEDDAATIIGCYATGSVLGGYSYGAAGGLVAESSTAGGTITRSHARASVWLRGGALGGAGGLIGVSSGLSISLSSASGRVGGTYGLTAGGLVGVMSGGSISQSFATSPVRVGFSDKAGGLIGGGNGGLIQDSYATGPVRGRQGGTRGGFAVAISDLAVHSSYSIGAVKGQHDHSGFVGVAGGGDDLKWDYWDIDTSGKTRGYGSCEKDDRCAEAILGLRTAQFLSGLPEGFSPKIWAQSPSINNGYPYLIANPPPQ